MDGRRVGQSVGLPAGWLARHDWTRPAMANHGRVPFLSWLTMAYQGRLEPSISTGQLQLAELVHLDQSLDQSGPPGEAGPAGRAGQGEQIVYYIFITIR